MFNVVRVHTGIFKLYEPRVVNNFLCIFVAVYLSTLIADLRVRSYIKTICFPKHMYIKAEIWRSFGGKRSRTEI